MYLIFKHCIADHQGGSVDTYYFVAQYHDYHEAVSVLTALREQVKDDSWTDYRLMADRDQIESLRSEIDSLGDHIEEIAYHEEY